METNTTKEFTMENENAISVLCGNLERLTIENKTNTDEYATALQALAKAITYSTLKTLKQVVTKAPSEKKHIKVDKNSINTCNVYVTVPEGNGKATGQRARVTGINPDGTVTLGLGKLNTMCNLKVLQGLKNSVAHDSTLLDTLPKMIALETFRINQNGDIEETTDKATKEWINDALGKTLGDGLDLVHEAIVKLLEETANLDTLELGYIEKQYQIETVKTKVRYKATDLDIETKTEDVSPIQQAYRQVRRYIDHSRQLDAGIGKYVYIDVTDESDITNIDDHIYLRLGKYSALGGEITDFNGKVTSITSDYESALKVESIINACHFTEREQKWVDLRLSGKGDKAISATMGITLNNESSLKRRVRQKALASGYFIKNENGKVVPIKPFE